MVDLGGEPRVMEELIQTFLAEGPRIVAMIQDGLAAKDVREVNRGAHSLKSTAAMFGAGRLSRLCRDLERTSETGITPEVAAGVALVAEEWASVQREIAAWKPG